jgi:hypothetical protein
MTIFRPALAVAVTLLFAGCGPRYYYTGCGGGISGGDSSEWRSIVFPPGL